MKKSSPANAAVSIPVLIALVAAAIFFWNSPVLYPVKLFTVLLHELSHGLAAMLTGGRIVGIEISPQIGGVCTSAGGMRIAVVSAGYFGSTMLGCGIVLIAARTPFDKLLSIIIGAGVVVITALYIRTPFGLMYGILFGATLLVIGRYAPQWINEMALIFLGLVSSLYAVIDIKDDLISHTLSCSDASVMASIIPLPPIVWGIIWIVIAALAVVFTLKWAFINRGE